MEAKEGTCIRLSTLDELLSQLPIARTKRRLTTGNGICLSHNLDYVFRFADDDVLVRAGDIQGVRGYSENSPLDPDAHVMGVFIHSRPFVVSNPMQETALDVIAKRYHIEHRLQWTDECKGTSGYRFQAAVSRGEEVPEKILAVKNALSAFREIEHNVREMLEQYLQ